MTKSFEAMYVAHFILREETLSIEDAIEYLSLLRGNAHAEFRDKRIYDLERYIADYERKQNAQTDRDRLNLEAAMLSRDLSAKWESQGATWREWYIYVIWSYKGEEFYRWSSGADVHIENPKKLAADQLLQQMLMEVGE